ncbi:MAG: SCO family protein [Verrucomicrobia bacterium]|nr:SCO family protein [Verrucomicrobiota bacterium]
MSVIMRGILIGVIALIFLIVGLVFLPKKKENEQWERENKIDTYWEVGDFELTNQLGEAFSSEQLKGKIWLANFVFTSCVAECPLLAQQMTLVRRNLGPRDDIAFVSFSVDPQTDSPERLKQFAAAYGEDPRWTLLTGEVDTVTDLVTSKFLLPLTRNEDGTADSNETAIYHSDKMLVVDGNGVVRYFCDGLNQRTVQSLTDVFQVLIQESGVY